MMSRMFVKDVTFAGNTTFDLVPTTGKRWKVHQGRFALVTDATVANRQLRFTPIDNDSHVIGPRWLGTIQAASGTTVTGFGPQAADDIKGGTLVDTDHFPLNFPIELDINEEMALQLSVDNGVAGDTVTGYVIVEEEPSGS